MPRWWWRVLVWLYLTNFGRGYNEQMAGANIFGDLVSALNRNRRRRTNLRAARALRKALIAMRHVGQT